MTKGNKTQLAFHPRCTDTSPRVGHCTPPNRCEHRCEHPTLRSHHGVHTKASHKPNIPDVPHQQNDRIEAKRKRLSPRGRNNRSRKKIAQRTPTHFSDTDFQSFFQSDISKNVTVTRMFDLPEATARRRAHRHPIF